jgi:hypothetical protein
MLVSIKNLVSISIIVRIDIEEFTTHLRSRLAPHTLQIGFRRVFISTDFDQFLSIPSSNLSEASRQEGLLLGCCGVG